MEFYKYFLKNEQIDGMIFDVDGTLLDSMPIWSHSGERYLKTIGVDAPPALGKILFSMTMQQGAEYIKKEYALSQPHDEIKAGIIQVVADAYAHEAPLKPAALPFLQALRAAEIPLTVVTSTDRPLITAAFDRLSLFPYFTSVMTCTDFGSGKDKPDIFYAAACAMHSAPERTWVVEDGLYAIRTAKQAGFRVIGTADAASCEDEPKIRRIADYFVTDFAMEVHGTVTGQRGKGK